MRWVLSKRALRLLLALIGFATVTPEVRAQAGRSSSRYHNGRELAAALDSLRRVAPQLIQLSTIAQSPGGLPVQAVRLAAGTDADDRPALLVIANAAGPHVVGSEVTLGVIRNLVAGYSSDSAVKRLLDHHTIYLIPRANPDAAEGMFARPMVELTRNAMPIDDDHDGAIDEDGPDDLNGDGLITLMRVSDSAGDWMADSADPQLLRQVDRGKGQAGTYRVYAEGRDNDKDERYNEDPPGGVDVNRNLTYGYEYFTEGSGDGPIATPESRAIAQFFVDHPNVTAVYVLGPQDNLVKAWEYKKEAVGPDGTPLPLTNVMQNDEPWFTEVSRRYQKLTGLEKGPTSADLKGDPLSFSYYHMGRFAWGTRTWWIPELPADTSKSAPKVDPKDPLKDDRNALHWLRANRPDAVIEWKEVIDPDFPGHKVEVGGLRPFVLVNPPDSLLDTLTTVQARLVREMADLLPSIAIRDVRVEQVGAGVFRIKARVANLGYLPTVSQLGGRVRWPRRVRVELKTDGQQIESGRKIQLLDPIQGSGGSTEVSWIVTGRADSRVTVSASSPVAGSASQAITLHPSGSR
ncbi:MAG TPA: M14 family metallopeptidase [Gemmatimonadales bacterium]|nr:M14 family metallopeptidase [Gemmatimonadales bacterium]